MVILWITHPLRNYSPIRVIAFCTPGKYILYILSNSALVAAFSFLACVNLLNVFFDWCFIVLHTLYLHCCRVSARMPQSHFSREVSLTGHTSLARRPLLSSHHHRLWCISMRHVLRSLSCHTGVSDVIWCPWCLSLRHVMRWSLVYTGVSVCVMSCAGVVWRNANPLHPSSLCRQPADTHGMHKKLSWGGLSVRWTRAPHKIIRFRHLLANNEFWYFILFADICIVNQIIV